MRWLSTSGEFASLSVGGTARGIIAVGWVAHGVVAVGGALSVGVISIGMNPIGSVAALGMNTAAPISLSLINGIGLYTLAGVNGSGAWTQAGTNATGMSSEGGVNSHVSMVPAILFFALTFVLTLLFPGRREPRVRDETISLRRFAASPSLPEGDVRSQLASIPDDDIELADGDTRLVVEAGAPRADARKTAVRTRRWLPRTPAR